MCCFHCSQIFSNSSCKMVCFLWPGKKITPIYKKSEHSLPQNYRLIAINGCIYRFYANVLRDLLTEWALAEHQISDTQFRFCPTRNTNQPIYILRHILTVAKLERKKRFTAFLDLIAAYDSVQRETMGPPSEHSCSRVFALSIKGFVPR